MEKFLYRHRTTILVGMLVVFGVLFALLSIGNHLCFKTYGLDLGAYTHASYKYVLPRCSLLTWPPVKNVTSFPSARVIILSTSCCWNIVGFITKGRKNWWRNSLPTPFIMNALIPTALSIWWNVGIKWLFYRFSRLSAKGSRIWGVKSGLAKQMKSSFWPFW